MEGIRKTAETAQPTVKQPSDVQGLTTIQYDGVPVDIYRFFGMDTGTTEGKTIDKLKTISEWAFSGDVSLGDGLSKLRQLEIQLGQPNISDTKEDKMFRWIKMQKQIEEIRKRQEAV